MDTGFKFGDQLLAALGERQPVVLKPFDEGMWNCFCGAQQPTAAEPQWAAVEVALIEEAGDEVTWRRLPCLLVIDRDAIQIFSDDEQDPRFTGLFLDWDGQTEGFHHLCEVVSGLSSPIPWATLLQLGFAGWMGA